MRVRPPEDARRLAHVFFAGLDILFFVIPLSRQRKSATVDARASQQPNRQPKPKHAFGHSRRSAASSRPYCQVLPTVFSGVFRSDLPIRNTGATS